MAMKLSTGKVAFPIEFDNGDKDCIYFNPNDKDFRDRFFNFENSIAERTKQIDLDKYKERFEKGQIGGAEITSFEDMLALSPDEIKKLKERIDVVEEIDAEYQNALKDELNDIFKSNVSSVIFKYCNPLDMVIVENENGEEESDVYIMHFVKQFAKEIEKYGAKNSSAVNKYMEKYPKK